MKTALTTMNRNCGILILLAAAMAQIVFWAPFAPCATLETASDQPEQAAPLQPAPPGWNTQFTFGYLPSADLHGMPASASIGEYRIKLARNIRLGNRFTLTLGGGYGLKHVDAAPIARLPENLHILYLEAGANYRFNEKNFVTLKMFPGIYSDLEGISGDAVRLPVLLLGGHSFDNGITLVGGMVYRFGYHSAELIPVIGLSYQPNEKWRVDMIAPRPGVTYSASRQVRLFIAGDLASDEYELKDPAVGAEVIKYRDYKVMGGIEYLPRRTVKISGALGYAFDRGFDFYNGNRGSIQLDNVPFLLLSLDLGW